MDIQVKRLDPQFRTGGLFYRKVPVETIISDARAYHMDEVGLFFSEVTLPVVDKIHEAGFKVHTFNPDTPEQILSMIHCHVDGIGNNRPDILVTVLKEQFSKREQ